MKILVRVAIIAVILGAGFLFRDRLSGNAGELNIGDCFDVPANQEHISDVQHHPCSEPHTGEVVYVGVHPASKGTPFAERTLLDFLGSACVPAFEHYIGPVNSDALDIGAFYPLEKDWNDGERGVTCYLYRIDDAAMTTSLKAT